MLRNKPKYTTLCSLFHGYVVECCAIPPWTKASERYRYHSSIRREALGFSVLGFWLFLIRFFGFAVLFCLRILRSLAYGLRDPILDSVRDPIQIFVDAAGELFYCFVANVDGQTSQIVGCAFSDLILLYAAMTTEQNQY